jgi:cytochrome c-type biogenesis protein CcmH
MTLWLVLTAMTAVALAALLVPLARRRGPARARREYDLQIFRDQLRELKSDVERGVVNATEAAAARTEIERRMLAVGREAEAGAASAAAGAGRARFATGAVLIGLGLGVPALAVALYLVLGSPGLPGQPFAARPDAPAMMAGGEAEDLSLMIENLSAKLEEEPENLSGWMLLGRSHLVTGHYPEAVAALRRAQALAGDDAAVAAELGEALVLAAGGTVTPEARALFEQTLATLPGDPVARFYDGLFEAQRGEPDAALEIWLALAAETPEDTPWYGQLKSLIEEAAGDAGVEIAEIPSAPPAAPRADTSAPGPSAEEMAAAQQMSADEQAAMIGGMVERLAARLEEEPDDRAGWLRLANAYSVLERYGDAAAAYAQALVLDPADPETLAAFGEAQVMLAGGRVSQDAYDTFAELARLDPENPMAPFYMGLSRAQEGDSAGAIEIWNDLAVRSDPASPWMAQLRVLAAAVAERSGLVLPETLSTPDAPAAEAAPGPSSTDVAAASAMSEDDQNAMIRSMVEGLAERLEADPDDLEGWLRLGRSYGVLGELADASAAYGAATALAPDDVSVLQAYAEALMAEADAEAVPLAAVAVYERILVLEPGHVDALWIVAMVRAEAGDLEGSIGLLEHLLSALPPGSESHATIQGLIDELRP